MTNTILSGMTQVYSKSRRLHLDMILPRMPIAPTSGDGNLFAVDDGDCPGASATLAYDATNLYAMASTYHSPALIGAFRPDGRIS